MPEMIFRVRWPDGEMDDCYSPSTVVREHLQAGTDYPLGEFRMRACAALEAANGRVRARFGMGCSQAIRQMALIESRAEQFAAQPDATVRVEGFLP